MNRCEWAGQTPCRARGLRHPVRRTLLRKHLLAHGGVEAVGGDQHPTRNHVGR